MAATALLQIKVDPKLKRVLEQLSRFYGLTLSSFVKMKLTETSRMEKSKIQNDIPFTRDPEDDFLLQHEKIIVQTLQEYLSHQDTIDEVFHVAN